MSDHHFPELLTVNEVADYLRIRERTIYELVRTGRIPHTKLSGKLLFPRRLVELWVAQSAEFPNASAHLTAPPPVVAGSHDPLLDWALREAGCGLAMLACGSSEGVLQLGTGQAVACGIHLVDIETGAYCAERATAGLNGVDFVVIEWARREQGFVVVSGNPLKLSTLADIKKSRARFAMRQEGAGTYALLRKIAQEQKFDVSHLTSAASTARTEGDVAAMVRGGEADVGLAIRAAAEAAGLGFIPLTWERYDLAVRRLEYFEPPIQKLLEFVRTARFAHQAAAMTGYDISGTGRVVLNSR